MRYLLFVFFILLFAVEGKTQTSPTAFKVMAWNILHGANDVADGKLHAINIIREINPDIILMVETYGSGKIIADSLGYHFHLVAAEGTKLDDKSVNLSIISRYPFGNRIDTPFPFYLGGREVLIQGRKVRLFSAWFHYLPWEDQPEKMGKNAEELLAWERTDSKYEMIQKLLPYISKYASEADSIPMVFGGDLNSPSHLDWSEETKGIHNNLVVPWYSTKVLTDLGLKDSYRMLNPSTMKNPGITWHTKGKQDQHRIDYIFYKSPQLTAVKSETYHAFWNEMIRLNNKEIRYPSDHGFVVTTFQLD